MIDNGDMRRFQITAFAGKPTVVYADRLEIAENGSTVLIVNGPHGDLIVAVVSIASQIVDLLAVEGAARPPDVTAPSAKTRSPARLTEHTPQTGT